MGTRCCGCCGLDTGCRRWLDTDCSDRFGTGRTNRFDTSRINCSVVVWTSQPVVFLLMWIKNLECLTPRNYRVRALVPSHRSAHILRGSGTHCRGLGLALRSNDGHIHSNHAPVLILNSIGHLTVRSLHKLNHFLILQSAVRYSHLTTVHIPHPHFFLRYRISFPFSVTVFLDPVDTVYNLFDPSELHLRPRRAGCYLKILGDESVIPHLENLLLVSTFCIPHQFTISNRNLDANLFSYCLAYFSTPVTTSFF